MLVVDRARNHTGHTTLINYNYLNHHKWFHSIASTLGRSLSTQVSTEFLVHFGYIYIFYGSIINSADKSLELSVQGFSGLYIMLLGIQLRQFSHLAARLSFIPWLKYNYGVILISHMSLIFKSPGH